MGKDTSKEWLDKAKAVANNGEFVANGGNNGDKPLVFEHGDEWFIGEVVFSNKFREDGKVNRLRIIVENKTKNFLAPVELTFLGRPIVVGDKVFQRDARCLFVATAQKFKGLSDKETTDLLTKALKNKSGAVEEQIHASDNHYRTEKKFIAK